MPAISPSWLVGLALLGGVGVATPTPPDPQAAFLSFLKAYWDPEVKYFLAWERSAPFPRIGGAGPKGGRYADFWWEARLWELVMDAYERDPTPSLRELIDAVYDGFAAQYPDWANDYNDDLTWWAQAALRAYRLTGEERYLERARSLFADVWRYWDAAYGGGVSWRRSNRTQKNMATNGPLTVVAAGLYQVTREPAYLEQARALWNWLDTHLTDGDSRVWDNIENGELRRWDFTYNFGNFIQAALVLREVSDDPDQRTVFLRRSLNAAEWVRRNLTNAGILLDEGGGDGGGFKGVFVRAVKELQAVPELGSADRARLASWLNDNATQVWNVRRPQDGLVGPDWASVQERGVVESLAAASAVAALLAAPGPLPPRYVQAGGAYEAENSPREGVSPSIAAPGYSGRGYVNGFFRDGQWVEFRVNVAAAGLYLLRWRYSAGGGAAVRQLLAGGHSHTLTFPPTPDWYTWAVLSTPLELPAGPSTLRLVFEGRAGSRGWLNLDSLELTDGR